MSDLQEKGNNGVSVTSTAKVPKADPQHASDQTVSGDVTQRFRKSADCYFGKNHETFIGIESYKVR
jgi:hypothetical protein